MCQEGPYEREEVEDPALKAALYNDIANGGWHVVVVLGEGREVDGDGLT